MRVQAPYRTYAKSARWNARVYHFVKGAAGATVRMRRWDIRWAQEQGEYRTRKMYVALRSELRRERWTRRGGLKGRTLQRRLSGARVFA